MADFKIRKGPSTVLFSEPGVTNPKLVIEEGCWYLTTDTAELFVGVLNEYDDLVLKRINDRNAADEPTFGPVIGELSPDAKLFKKIMSEGELPTEFEAEDFNPNVTYYIPILNLDGTESGRVSTYIFDRDAQCYMCTNSIDEIIVKAMVADAIELIIDETIATKISDVVRQTIETTVLYGGDATPEDN